MEPGIVTMCVFLIIMCNSFPGSSFSENFYGMKRVAVSCDATNDTDGASDVSGSSTGTESDQEQSTTSSTLYHSLPKSNMNKSLLFLVSRYLYLSDAYFADKRQLWSLNIFILWNPIIMLSLEWAAGLYIVYHPWNTGKWVTRSGSLIIIMKDMKSTKIFQA